MCDISVILFDDKPSTQVFRALKDDAMINLKAFTLS